MQLLEKEPLNDCIDSLDKNGLTPFLAFIDEYVAGLKNAHFRNKITNAIQWNSFKHGQTYSKYKITNADLFCPAWEEDQSW